MNKENAFQVAIVGGGLAGLTLAIQMAQSGHSVVLFEKNRYPFHKVCGEYISNESKPFLESLGLDLDVLDLPQIKRLEVSSPSGKLLEHQLDLGGFGISRHLLDDQLAAIAKKAGVIVLEECKVHDIKFQENKFTITTSRGDFISEICAGAWGKKSNLDVKSAREFKKTDPSAKNYVGIKYHIKLDFPPGLIGLHNFKDGYCGISKIEGEKYCLCYLTDSANLKKYNGNIREMEKNILMKNPYLKKYFSGAKFLFEVPMAISNIKIGYKSAVEDHVLMLGDAAGNIAPLSGNGMSMAMRSSFILNKLLRKYFEKKITREDLEKEYTKQWQQQFKKRIVFSGFLQKMLKNTIMTNTVISALKVLPSLRDKVVRSTHGKSF